jgi:hypothetical protein
VLWYSGWVRLSTNTTYLERKEKALVRELVMMKRDLKADLERRANNDSDTECRSELDK